MNTTHIALQFIISGGVVVGATLLAKNIDSKWAGLLVALPIMTLLGLVFISNNVDVVNTQKYLLSAILFMIPAALYLLSVYLMYGRMPLIANCILSTIPLGIAVFFLQKVL